MTPLDRMKAVAAQENRVFRRRFGTTAPTQNNRTTPEITARRAKVAELRSEGKTRVEIAELLGVPFPTIKKDFAMAGRD